MSDPWYVGETRFLGLPRRRGILVGVISLLAITALVAGIVAWLGAGGISLAVATLGFAALSAFLLFGQFFGLASVLAAHSTEDERKRR